MSNTIELHTGLELIKATFQYGISRVQHVRRTIHLSGIIYNLCFLKKDLVLHSNLVLNVKLSLFSNAQKSKEILYFLFIANKSGTIIIKGVEIFNTQHSNQSQPTRKFTLSTSQTNMLDSCWLLSSASVLRLFKRIGKAEHCKSAKSHLPSPSALSNHKNSKQYY